MSDFDPYAPNPTAYRGPGDGFSRDPLPTAGNLASNQFAGQNAKSADAIQIDGTHYKDMAMQPWDVMQAVLTHSEFVGFLKGNLIKYLMRDGKKPGAEADAKKAQHYRQKLKEVQG